MYDILAPINLFVWVAISIIYLVGNLTYADYYTKLESDTKQILNAAIGVQAMCFLVNMAVVSLVGQSIEKGFRYGLAWCTGVSVLMYVVIVCFGCYYGFIELKEYFGKKRGKI